MEHQHLRNQSSEQLDTVQILSGSYMSYPLPLPLLVQSSLSFCLGVFHKQSE